MSGPRIATLSSGGGGGHGGGGGGPPPRGGGPSSTDPVPPPSNWFTEWQGRTPLITRAAIFTVLPVSLVCLFWEAGNAALIMTPAGIFRGQVWRLVTSLINQGGFLNLAFTLLVLAMTGPATERQLGSMRFLLFLLAYGVLINLVFGIITVGAWRCGTRCDATVAVLLLRCCCCWCGAVVAGAVLWLMLLLCYCSSGVRGCCGCCCGKMCGWRRGSSCCAATACTVAVAVTKCACHSAGVAVRDCRWKLPGGGRRLAGLTVQCRGVGLPASWR